MSNLTERHAWKLIDAAVKFVSVAHRGYTFTRIESPTHAGISDIEYVAGRYHGWIELKVMSTHAASAAMRFGHEFTLEQYQWLCAHHRPEYFLRSWLLMHRPKDDEARWVLAAPSAAFYAMNVRLLSFGNFVQLPYVFVFRDPYDLVHDLATDRLSAPRRSRART